MGIPKFNAKEAGLKVYSSAKDAANDTNARTSIDTFSTNVLALYDLEKEKYVTPKGVDLEDPAAVKKWVDANGGADRYAVLFGDSMENADGFMSLNGYIETFTGKESSEDKNKNNENNENLNNPEVSTTIGDEAKKGSLRDILSVMAAKNVNEVKATIDGVEGVLHLHEDGTSTFYHQKDGNDVWITYDPIGNIKSSEAKYNQQTNNTPEVSITIGDEKKTAALSVILGMMAEKGEESVKATINGIEGELRRYDDGTSTFYFKKEDGTDVWLTSDANGSIKEIRGEYKQKNYNNPADVSNSVDGAVTKTSLKATLGKMGEKNVNDAKVTIDGIEGKLTRFEDGTSTFNYQKKDGSNVWTTYDKDGNIKDTRTRLNGKDTVTTYKDGYVDSTQYNLDEGSNPSQNNSATDANAGSGKTPSTAGSTSSTSGATYSQTGRTFVSSSYSSPSTGGK